MRAQEKGNVSVDVLFTTFRLRRASRGNGPVPSAERFFGGARARGGGTRTVVRWLDDGLGSVPSKGSVAQNCATDGAHGGGGSVVLGSRVSPHTRSVHRVLKLQVI